MKKIVSLAVLFALFACKKPEGKSAGTHAAAIIFVSGTEAKVISAKGTIPAVKGTILQQSDRIETGAKSQVDLLLPGKIMIRIDHNTTVEMRSFAAADGGQSDKLYLQRGLIFAKVSKLGPHSSFAIQTPTITAGVRGTEFITASDEKGAGKVAVTEGKVAVAAASGEKEINPGEQANVSDSGSVEQGKLDDATAAQIKQLSTVANITAQQAQIFEDALKQQKEALEKAGGTDKIKGIIEENDKKMQEKRDEATKKVEEQKGQTENKIQEMNKGTEKKIDEMKNSIEEQKKKREELFKKFPQK